MKDGKDIQFITGNVELGWSKFSVRLGEESWSCSASYIDAHPLHDLLYSAVEIYDHIFNSPIREEYAVWYSSASDEPGGIVVKAVPQGEKIEISIFRYEEEAWPEPEKLPHIAPVAIKVIDYWDYANAVFYDASRAIARHGFTGFRYAWEHDSLGADFHCAILPVEYFFILPIWL